MPDAGKGSLREMERIMEHGAQRNDDDSALRSMSTVRCLGRRSTSFQNDFVDRGSVLCTYIFLKD